MTPRESILWHQTSAERLRFDPLVGTHAADVVVIGGGYTGLSAALHLAQSGARVTVVEAVRTGHGASGRNVGLVNAGLWTPPDQIEEKLGKSAGQKLNAALAKGPDLVFDLIEKHQISCEARRSGTLHCAHCARGLRDLENRHAQQARRGAPVRLLGKTETEARTGSSIFHGALWDGRAGTIQPAAYAGGLARAAHGAGAIIHEASCVTGLARKNDIWRVATQDGEVHAPRVIQATNAYGIAGARQNGFVLAHYFQCATSPLPTELRASIMPGGEGCWDTARIMSSARMDHAGRLVFGALGSLDHRGRMFHMQWARRALSRWFPAVAKVPFESHWTGRVAMNSSHLPRVEAVGPGMISIHGYSGRGISPGTVFGKSAAQWALDEDKDAFPVAITDPRTERFAKIKSIHYEAAASLMHLATSRR